MRTAIRPTHLHFRDLANPFLALSSGVRFLRFGWVMTDVEIVAYVESMFVSVDNAWAVVEPDRDISGVVHLESMGCGVNLGLSVSAWAPKALTTSLEVPPANGHITQLDEFRGKITLADDSLRSEWNAVSGDPSLLDLPEPIFH